MVAATAPAAFDRPMDAVTIAREFGVARHKHEKVIYYRKPQSYPAVKGRRPRPALEAGWIVIGDSNQSARDVQLQKGHVPLAGYGFIHDDDPNYQEYGNLGPLLWHPGNRRAGLVPGAHLFPVEQIKANRWYDADLYPELVGKFPQLAGVEITEYPCPDCQRPAYHDAMDLGLHLRNSHNYDRTDLIALGKELGISFARIYEGRARGKRVLAFDGTETSPGEDAEEAAAPPVPPPALKRVPVRGRGERAASPAGESAE